MFVQAIGWLSSLILVLTIAQQVWKQWQERASEGISKWLFVGQTAASAGFTTYSWLVQDWVFVVTNSLMLTSALLGYFILMRNRRLYRSSSSSSSASSSSTSRSPSSRGPVSSGGIADVS